MVSDKYLSDYSFFVFLRKSYISLRLVITFHSNGNQACAIGVEGLPRAAIGNNSWWAFFIFVIMSLFRFACICV